MEDTTVYPSGSPNARSRMEIHMGEDAMTTAEFEAAFMDEAATAKIRLTKTTDEDNTKIVFDTVYQHYCLVASIGKKRVSKTDIATGQVVEEMHLVAELEQRTCIEQQLAAGAVKEAWRMAILRAACGCGTGAAGGAIPEQRQGLAWRQRRGGLDSTCPDARLQGQKHSGGSLRPAR